MERTKPVRDIVSSKRAIIVALMLLAICGVWLGTSFAQPRQQSQAEQSQYPVTYPAQPQTQQPERAQAPAAQQPQYSQSPYGPDADASPSPDYHTQTEASEVARKEWA